MHHVLEWYPLVQLIVRISRTIIGLRILFAKWKVLFSFFCFQRKDLGDCVPEEGWQGNCNPRDGHNHTNRKLSGWYKKIGKMCGKSNTDKPSQLLQKKFGIQIEKIYQSSWLGLFSQSPSKTPTQILTLVSQLVSSKIIIQVNLKSW